MDATFDERATGQLSAAIGQWDQGATCLAALAVAAGTEVAGTGVAGTGVAGTGVAGTGVAGTGAAGPLVACARDVVAAAGLGDVLAFPQRLPFSPAQLRGMAASPLLQAAALIDAPHGAWRAQNDSTLTAQGQASGSTAVLFARFVLPHFGDLADRLARPGARMLDVGTGIGSLAIGCAHTFPQLHVTGIDVMPRVMELARAHVGASPVASRVELRQQDVAELTDELCYDLAWIPAPFVPEPAFSTGVARIITALRPGGVLVIGHGTVDGTNLEIAITRFKTVLYGGTALDGPSATRLLTAHGLTSVQTVPTPPGAPALTAGRR